MYTLSISCCHGHCSADNAKVFHQEISSDELGFAYFSMVSGCVGVARKEMSRHTRTRSRMQQWHIAGAYVWLYYKFLDRSDCRMQTIKGLLRQFDMY